MFATGPDGLPHPERDRQFYAGVPLRRLLAWGADASLALLCTLVVLVLLALPTLGFILLVPFGVFAVIDLALRIATLAGGSATPGMRLMGLELRTGSGDRVDGGTAVLHTLFTWMAFAVFPAQLVSVILMAGTPRGQGLPDLLLGTAVINRPA